MFLFYALSVFAETIVLKSGKTVEGKITEKTSEKIKVDISGIPVTYYLDQIVSIDGKKIESSPVAEAPVDKKEPQPLEQTKPQTKETSSSGKAKDETACQDWINSKEIKAYFEQEQAAAREIREKGEVIMKKMGSESETIAAISELKELGSAVSKKMKELIPPQELSKTHQLAIESMEYGQLALEASINKDSDKADSYYIKQTELDKKAHEELKRLYTMHACSPEFIQAIDKIIEDEEKEIKLRSSKLKPKN